jgi:hypothetical protein
MYMSIKFAVLKIMNIIDQSADPLDNQLMRKFKRKKEGGS